MPSKKELQIYGSLINQHKPTIRSIIANMLFQYFEKKNRYRHPVDYDNISIEEKLKNGRLENSIAEEFSYFALVKDGIVEETIIVNDLLGELFRDSEVQIVEFLPYDINVVKDMQFDGENFLKNEEGATD